MQDSELPHIYVVQVGSHLKLLRGVGSDHGLPSGGDRRDELPMVFIAHLDRHGKCRFVGLPAIRYGMSLGIKAQFERWNGGMTQILVEDRGQVGPAMPAEVGRDVCGHDGLVFEVLVVVVQKSEPFTVIIDNAAHGVEEETALLVLVETVSRP
jgi:hypothetical protein